MVDGKNTWICNRSFILYFLQYNTYSFLVLDNMRNEYLYFSAIISKACIQCF